MESVQRNHRDSAVCTRCSNLSDEYHPLAGRKYVECRTDGPGDYFPALIVIEDEILLNEYVRTGIDIDAIISSQLLINIFEKNTPLHDGAVIVRGDRVVSATCYLPLSDSMTLSKDLGTRHRAAVGISEVSDSLTIVVSEETGKVSIAMRGQIYRNVNADFLRGKLKYLQNRNQQVTKLRLLKRRFMNGKKDSKNLGE